MYTLQKQDIIGNWVDIFSSQKESSALHWQQGIKCETRIIEK